MRLHSAAAAPRPVQAGRSAKAWLIEVLPPPAIRAISAAKQALRRLAGRGG